VIGVKSFSIFDRCDFTDFYSMGKPLSKRRKTDISSKKNTPSNTQVVPWIFTDKNKNNNLTFWKL